MAERERESGTPTRRRRRRRKVAFFPSLSLSLSLPPPSLTLFLRLSRLLLPWRGGILLAVGKNIIPPPLLLLLLTRATSSSGQNMQIWGEKGESMVHTDTRGERLGLSCSLWGGEEERSTHGRCCRVGSENVIIFSLSSSSSSIPLLPSYLSSCSINFARCFFFSRGRMGRGKGSKPFLSFPPSNIFPSYYPTNVGEVSTR